MAKIKQLILFIIIRVRATNIIIIFFSTRFYKIRKNEKSKS